ncbi:MAG: hypothetical protein FWF99_01905 [Desulfovibrionaceae bacterium]|nr:hypothetical protein [Desulfovibrionaceae bacterium]
MKKTYTKRELERLIDAAFKPEDIQAIAQEFFSRDLSMPEAVSIFKTHGPEFAAGMVAGGMEAIKSKLIELYGQPKRTKQETPNDKTAVILTMPPLSSSKSLVENSG